MEVVVGGGPFSPLAPTRPQTGIAYRLGRVLFSLTEAGRVPLTGAWVTRKIFGTSEHWGNLTEFETSGGSAD